jgi:lysozyme family protein
MARMQDKNRFDTGLTFVLHEEIGPYGATAGYVSAEQAQKIGDTGGETLAGMARNKNPEWAGWAIVDQRKGEQRMSEPDFPRNLNIDLPRNAELRRLLGERYLTNYWHAFRCGELPPGLDFCMFDAAVQHLPKTAILLVQRAIGTQPDGDLGDKSIIAAHRAPRVEAIENYFVNRAGLYADLITADSSKAKFRNTWFRRLFRLNAYIIATTPGGNG